MPKGKRLNAIYYFVMNIPNKGELQQIGSNHSSDVEFKGFMKLYTKGPFSVLLINAILPLDNALRFMRNL